MWRVLLPGTIFGFLVAACGATQSNGDGSGGAAGHGSGGDGGTAAGGGKATGSGGGSATGGGETSAGGAKACTQVIPEGAKFKLTILEETAVSSRCHVVSPARASPFLLTAGKAEPSNCAIVPAAAPAPLELDVMFGSCVPSTSEMFGVYCAITYKEGCAGHLLSYVASLPGAIVNWGAPVIDNVVFRVQDFTPNCFVDTSNCLDEYAARLERIQ